MTYMEAKAIRDQLEHELALASKPLEGYPRNEIGLTPDPIKFSPEYRAKRQRFSAALARLQKFNRWFVRAYAAEYRAERKARRQQFA